MSDAGGRPYLAIPGPSVMPEEVLRAMHRTAPNIYAGEVVDVTDSLIPDLRRVARTEGHATIYIANGHGAWEASLANVVGPGDHVLVPATGRFGLGWAEIAESLGVEVEPGLDRELAAPEPLGRAPIDAPGMVAFDASIRDVIFLGSVVQYTAQLSSGFELMFREQRGPNTDTLGSGEPVRLAFQPQDAVTLVDRDRET